ncbi:hypothetical protein AB0I94_21505 [Streptomyces sp. NPDC050147]|uniref:hypothetical protein n=1 Tax=Streptomyces sp. NPDC050147 TaxID=3155513 RepID=UPI00343F915A
MTNNGQSKPLSVYRLLPSMSEFQLLYFDNSLVEVVRWQFNGSTGDHPTRFNAEWGGHEKWPKSDFPNGDPASPVLSRRIVDALQEVDFAAAGRLLPVHIEGPDNNSRPKRPTEDEYLLYLVEHVADCIDSAQSSPPDHLERIQRAVFRPDAVPAELPAFRAKQFPTAVCWNGWMVERLTHVLGDQLEARLVWSEDPTLTPHHAPWGF